MKQAIVTLSFILAFFSVSPLSAADVDDFSITDFDVKMTLSKDSEGRSQLRTTETITADFPQEDVNHGLERVFEKDYDGHPTNFKLESVKNRVGGTLKYNWQGDALRIGDPDEYVHGKRTYVITYTQRDVTRQFVDTNKQEFYWDAIGVEWRVPIEKASVSLELDRSLATAVQTDAQCYQGASGSTNRCTAVETNSSTLYKVTAENLRSGEGVTLALGFKPGTFGEYSQTLFEKLSSLWLISNLIGFGLVCLMIVAVQIWRARRLGRNNEVGTIVTEYVPPKTLSVSTASKVLSTTPSSSPAFSQQVLDLAVRHYVTLHETKQPTRFSAGSYEVEVTKDTSKLFWEENQMLADLFASDASMGDRFKLASLAKDKEYYKRKLITNVRLNKLVRSEYGLKEFDHVGARRVKWLAVSCLIVGLLVLNIPLFTFGVLTWLLTPREMWRLSDEGLKQKRYLLGLKKYIKTTEEERIKLLQSPEGSEKLASLNSDGTEDAKIKLYERLLPYAVLFKSEKQWTKQLGEYYKQADASPVWFSGVHGFNGPTFSSSMSGFKAEGNAVTGGGSSGGGSSGGGGGGGGGGGW